MKTRNLNLFYLFLFTLGILFPSISFAGFSERDLMIITDELEKFQKTCGHLLDVDKEKCDSKAAQLKNKLEKLELEMKRNYKISPVSSDRCKALSGTPVNLMGGLSVEDSKKEIERFFPSGNQNDEKNTLTGRAIQLFNSEGAKLVIGWPSRINKNLSNKAKVPQCRENEVEISKEMIGTQKRTLDSLKSKYHAEIHRDIRNELARNIEETNLKLKAVQYLYETLGEGKCLNSQFYNEFMASTLQMHDGPVSMTHDETYALLKMVHDYRKEWKEAAKQAPIADKGWIVRDFPPISSRNGSQLYVHVEANDRGKIRIRFQKRERVEKVENVNRVISSEVKLGSGADMTVFSTVISGKEGLKFRAELRPNKKRVSKAKNSSDSQSSSSSSSSSSTSSSSSSDSPVEDNLTRIVMRDNREIFDYIERNAKDREGIINPEIFKKADKREVMEARLYEGNLAKFNKLSREEILDIYHRIAVGLKNLHAIKILHGDFKEQNILIRGYGKRQSPRKRDVVVSDLGYSIILNETNSTAGDFLPVRGSPITYPPEIWSHVDGKSREEIENRILKRDVYGFGIELAGRLQPIQFEMDRKSRDGIYRSEGHRYIPSELCTEFYGIDRNSREFPECYQEMAIEVYQEYLQIYHNKVYIVPPEDGFDLLILNCLNPDPDKRPTMAEVVTRFEKLQREEKLKRFMDDEKQRQARAEFHKVNLGSSEQSALQAKKLK